MRGSIAVIIPAYNEEITISKVVKDFKKELPKADIFVFDNNSTDNTGQLAKKAGANVVTVRRIGKGNVIQHAFEILDYDYFVIVDADDTYPAESIHDLLTPVLNGRADMMVGSRMEGFKKEKKSLVHKIGNNLILWALHFSFPTDIKDMLSGYRVFNRDIVNSINITSRGFTIETELTIKTLESGFKIGEIPVKYRPRPTGSESKLDTWGDGLYILTTVMELFRDHRPMQFFIAVSMIPFSLAVGFGYVIIKEMIKTGGNVTKYGSLIMAISFMLITLILLSMGFIASSVRKSHIETMSMLKKMKRKQ
ncbi:MAG: glycosyltransferase family 2 protein [Nanoarchaeota archaeon]